jgi:hypothetical protein
LHILYWAVHANFNVWLIFYLQLENCPLDRKTFIVKQEEGYVVNRVITQGEVSLNSYNTRGGKSE